MLPPPAGPALPGSDWTAACTPNRLLQRGGRAPLALSEDGGVLDTGGAGCLHANAGGGLAPGGRCPDADGAPGRAHQEERSVAGEALGFVLGEAGGGGGAVDLGGQSSSESGPEITIRADGEVEEVEGALPRPKVSPGVTSS